jgi:hypothetical protein
MLTIGATNQWAMANLMRRPICQTADLLACTATTDQLMVGASAFGNKEKRAAAINDWVNRNAPGLFLPDAIARLVEIGLKVKKSLQPLHRDHRRPMARLCSAVGS